MENVNKIVQVLVATMNQNDYSLLDKMNIQSDAIVGNQCTYNSIEKFNYKTNNVVYLNFNEKGVGLNRNNALMRATGDICLFADDDMVYVDDYVNKIKMAFENHPNADVIVFNLIEEHAKRYKIEKVHRVRWYNYLRYGTARIAIKLDKIRDNAIYFNQCYGGGTKHSHGEDNLFLTDCLRKKLKIYAVPLDLAKLTEERESTWNKGYNKKYFIDQGALYKAISPKWWKILCLQDSLRHFKIYNKNPINCYKDMVGDKYE